MKSRVVVLMALRQSIRCIVSAAFASSIHGKLTRGSSVIPKPPYPHGKTHTLGPLDTRRLYSTTASSNGQGEEKEISMKNLVEESLLIAGSRGQKRRIFGGSVEYFDQSLASDNKEEKEEESYRVLFILGGPGAGKGTQCNLLKEEYPCIHLSVGELLRNEQKNNKDSPHGKIISECLVAGKIVPVEISLGLLQNAMREASKTHGSNVFFLVDGFPRNFDNLQGWNRCMNGTANVWGVLVYQCPLDILQQRILSRGSTSGRTDDNLESARKRFQTFERDTIPVVETLERVQNQLETNQPNVQPIQVVNVQAQNGIPQVWQDTQSVMNSWLANDVWSACSKLVRAIETRDEETYRSLCSSFLMNQQEEEGEHQAQRDSIATHEGNGVLTELKNAEIEFHGGKQATTSFDRTLNGVEMRETRVWALKEGKGWINIHFSRIPK